ncbi:MAG TPA: hypothetical protein VLT32_14800 [Candidatus Sulfomarinibacteraceae bacterium]|nr:hypothetical protein [Candidatus Sulfomarinibacteraceae bacterium]
MMRSRSFVLVAIVAVAAAGAVQAGTTGQLSWSDVLLDKTPTTVVPPPPDPDVILQGGDTCATATVISSLPYTDDGTTVGYTNDYDEVCPYSDSTSPDVVYAFTPATDMAIDISLCVGTTNYDTKLYVYEGSCPGAGNIACNDDECTAPLYPSSFVSSLTAVPLTGGQTYYIVVDGYGGDSGPYSIDVAEWQPPPPPVECDGPELLYYQTVHTPDDSWNAFTSGQTSSFNYTVFDNFNSDMFSVTDFHWWGLSLFWTGSGWTTCDPTGMTFDITFHPDSGGQPGAATCTYAGVMPTAVPGLSYGGYTLYYWEVTGLSPVCQPTGETWVGVHSYPNAAGCAMLWMSASSGDGNLLQYDGTAYSPQPYDAAFCVTGNQGGGDADIEVTKTAQTTGPTTGVYRIRVDNLGPDDATGVVVTDDLPAGVAYVSDDCGGVPGTPWTWNVGALMAGAFETCNITVDIVDPANTANVANATSSMNDPDPTNNTSATAQLPPFGGPIPTLGSLGLFLLVGLIAGSGLILLRRLL